MSRELRLCILVLSDGLPRSALGAAIASSATSEGSASRAGSASTPSDLNSSLIEQLFGSRVGTVLPPLALADAVRAPDGKLYAARFGTTELVCGAQLTEIPDLADALENVQRGRIAFRLALNSASGSVLLEILAPDGDLLRSLLVLRGEGVLFDEGPHLDFESPYWEAGEQFGLDATGLDATVSGSRFDPVEFGLAALETLFGIRAEDGGQRIGTDPSEPSAALIPGFSIDPIPARAPASSRDRATDLEGVSSLVPETLSIDDSEPRAANTPTRAPTANVPAEDTGTSPDRGRRTSWWTRFWQRLTGTGEGSELS
jgi:hypothetical protein